MAQDWTAVDASATVKANIIDALALQAATLRTLFSGPSAPTSPVAGQLWLDTSTGAVKQRDLANSAWNSVWTVGTARADDVEANQRLENVSATTTWLWIAKEACTLVSLHVAADTATSSSDGSNNYEFDVVNQNGGASLFATNPTTNGSEFAAYTEQELAFDQNTTIAAGDVIEVTLTKNGTGPAGTDWTAAVVTMQLEGHL